MQLVATDILAQYQVDKPFRLPFHSGSMLRGVLGRALHKAGCAQRATACKKDCEMPTQCTYARFFDPLVPSPVPHRFLRGQTRAPQPLIPVFTKPGQVEMAKGQKFSFTLRVLGPLKQGELETLLMTLTEMSAFDLGNESGHLAFDGALIQGRPEKPIVVDADAGHVERIEVVFETPAWLEHNGRIMETIAFHPFFRSVYRRLTILCALYGTGADAADNDFARLDALAGGIEWVKQDITLLEPWKRLSQERNVEHEMRGVLGRVIFAGKELGAFMPILRMAEKTHIGKATSFGLGRIRVERLA
jgi:hypothetical protein